MSASAPEWYYIKDGNRLGPVTGGQLKQMAGAGQLQPTDLIWKNGMANWMAASSVKGLFASPITAAPPAAAPPMMMAPAAAPPMRDDRFDDYDRGPSRAPVRRTSGRFTFDGTGGGFFLTYLLFYLMCVFSLGIATPWGLCMLLRWKRHHTIIDGKRLKFIGSGGELFLRFLLWWFLCLITIGIYAIWMVPAMLRWTTENTDFDEGGR